MQKEDSSEEISIDWDRVAPHFTRQGATLMRVHNLVCLYDRLIKEVDGENKEDKLDAGDILRSAVVLLHASLEDLVRTYAATFLTRDEELFKEVGLVGKPPNSRICLGDFVKHRNKSVDELLEESIHSWLHRSFTISSNRDLIDMLKRLKIDPRPFQANFKDLETMINRRHIIVHNADLSRDTTPLVNPISRNDVDLWLGNVAEITGKMLAVGVMLD